MTAAAPLPLCIVNPRAADGSRGAMWPEVRAALTAAIGPVDAVMTNAPGSATALARDALAAGRTWLIAVGGDGTVNEVMNGMLGAGARVGDGLALSFVMLGTGNDLRKTLTGSRDWRSDVHALAAGTVRRIDVARVDYTDHDGTRRSRCFDNVLSFGMGGAVVEHLNASRVSRWLGGGRAFVWSTLMTLIRWRDCRVDVTADGSAAFSGLVRLGVVANGQYAGGGMWFAPHAKNDDGRLELVLFGGVGLARSLWNLRRLFDGSHIGMPFVHTATGRRFDLASDARLLLDLDGEQVGRLPATITVLPAALPVRC